MAKRFLCLLQVWNNNLLPIGFWVWLHLCKYALSIPKKKQYVEVMADMNSDQVWRNLLAQIGQRVAATEAGYRPAHREKKEKPS